jgi:hypothetical protein
VELNPSGITYAQAYATNGTQQVGVGFSEDGIGVVARAMVWSGTAASAVDLSSFIPASSDEHYATSIDAYGNVVERPTEQLLASAATAANGATPAFVNPKVEPGKVKWHADIATARAASAKSGKPVLLFQMMGKLDDQFC